MRERASRRTRLTMHEEQRHRFFSLYDGVIAFSEWCALRFLPPEGGDVRVLMPFLPRFAGPDGAISPGMAAGLADVIAGQASVPAFDWTKQVATVSLQQSVLAPIPPAKGLIGRGRTLSCCGDLAHVSMEIAAEDRPDVPLLTAQARMIAVRDVSDTAVSGRTHFPLHVDFDPDPRFGPEGMETTPVANGLQGRLPYQAHFMGNASRNALHGGLIAAALYTAAERYGASLADPLKALDSTVDFLATGRPRDLDIRIQAERTGRRIAFLTGHALQAHPEGGEPVVVARLSATLGKLGP